MNKLSAVAARVVKSDFVTAYPVVGEAIKRKLVYGLDVGEMSTVDIIAVARQEKSSWARTLLGQQSSHDGAGLVESESEITDQDICRELVRTLSSMDQATTTSHNDLICFSIFVMAMRSKHGVYEDRFIERMGEHFKDEDKATDDDVQSAMTKFLNELVQVEATLVRSLSTVVKEVEFAVLVLQSRCDLEGGGGPRGGGALVGGGERSIWLALVLFFVINAGSIAAHLAIRYS
mmetsp:Transcript_44123/g.140451  ORF Transcript_44123/g.140451 Transcript_44123/m.140451 type:complete len:233 (-) Transcript_44123:60-758(-)